MHYLKSMLSDGINDCVSSKRVVTFLAFILCTIAFVSDLFFGLKMDTRTYESMMYIVIAGLGFTASEKFAPKQKEN
jgi:hypothetical protein